jgi:hypothetical protein
MKKHNIDLATLTPYGEAKIKSTSRTLDLWTTHSITSIAFNLYGDSYKKHYVSLPETYHLPFRVDMTVSLDFPLFIMLIGGGHITFASTWQDNRKIEDIAKPSGKPNQDHNSYNNSLPFTQYADISVTYNFDEMQILINGEERFYSRKQAYMRVKTLKEQNTEGFSIKLAVSKLSTLNIKNITVTEFDEKAPVTRGAFEIIKPQPMNGERPKPTFENVISGLPQESRNEVIKTDSFLMSLYPVKFKRMVDKNGGKISYVASDFGFSYMVNVSGVESSQNFGWYIVTGGKPETWYRKADYMEETLAEITRSDAPLAERIFYALNDCVSCCGQKCLAKTPYAFYGQKKVTCHGRVVLRMYSSDSQDARGFFLHLNTLMERKIADGAPPVEKILLMKAGNK